MPVIRQQLTSDEVAFEISFAVGRVPRSVWVRVRGKDRIASDQALEQVVQAVAARFQALEVFREYDPSAFDFREMGKRA